MRTSIVLKRDIPVVEGEISFGRGRFDLARREPRRDETLVRLGSRALDILCVGLGRGKSGYQDELIAQVWTGVVDEENNIQVHISALRKTLEVDKNGKSGTAPVDGLIELPC